MVVWALAPFFTVTVHVVPTELSDNVLLLTKVAPQAKPHIKVGAAFIDMPVGAVFSSVAFLLDEIKADFQVMTEIAPFAIGAEIIVLELLAGFDLGLVMRMRAAVALLAFPMDELFTHSIRRQLWVVAGGCGRDRRLIVISSLRIHVVVGVDGCVLLLILFIILAHVDVGVGHGSNIVCLQEGPRNNKLDIISKCEMESIVSQPKIHFYEFMEIEILHEYIQTGIEYMVKSILNGSDKLTPFRYFSQEIATFISALKDIYFLIRHKAIYAENFYGLERSNPRTSLSTLIDVLVWIILPYMFRKLEAKFNLLKDKQTSGILLGPLSNLYLKIFPLCFCLIKGISAAMKFRYLMKVDAKFYNLSYLAATTQLAYIEQPTPSPYPIMNFLKSPGLFLLLVAHKIASYAFSGEKKNKSSSQVSSVKAPIESAKATECPICGKRFKSPTVLRTSGYVFCYGCIAAEIKRQRKCPISQIPSDESQLQIIYE